MSKTPFFMRFVENAPTPGLEPEVKAGAESGTSYWKDKAYEPTLKYPSDDDEPKSTYKGGSWDIDY